MRILVDLDGVVCDTLPHWLQYIQRLTRTKEMPEGVLAKVSDIHCWELHLCHPLSSVDTKLIFGILEQQNFTYTIPPMPGAATALKKLIDDKHDVRLVTARSGPVAMGETLEWVKKHLPFIDVKTQLIFCADKELISADVLIDDKAQTLQRYGFEHSEALLLTFNYPYNRHIPDMQVARFDRSELAWGSVVGYLQAHVELMDRESK